jgi:hypothetical protein
MDPIHLGDVGFTEIFTVNGSLFTCARPISRRRRNAMDESNAMEPAIPSCAALPADRAFVVQLRADADIARGVVSGRIEHVSSDAAALFESVEQLIDCIRDAVARHALPGPDPAERGRTRRRPAPVRRSATTRAGSARESQRRAVRCVEVSRSSRGILRSSRSAASSPSRPRSSSCRLRGVTGSST